MMVAGWIAIAVVSGSVLGGAYFAALRWNVSLYLAPGRRVAAIALHVARLATVGAALYLAARLGAGVLLAATIGMLATRMAVTHIREVR